MKNFIGNVIEKASGKSYWDFLRERIFLPLGMTATRSSDPAAIIPDRARGYEWSRGDHRIRRYRALLGTAHRSFSFALAPDGTIAQINWW